MLDFALIENCFEQTMLAYNERRWDDLLHHLAPKPRSEVSKALKEHGEQFIIDTGQIPHIWQYQHAMPAGKNLFQIYALMANYNAGEELKTYKLVFVRAQKRKDDNANTPQWLLSTAVEVSEEVYNQGIYACLQWAPGYYYYPLEDD